MYILMYETSTTSVARWVRARLKRNTSLCGFNSHGLHELLLFIPGFDVVVLVRVASDTQGFLVYCLEYVSERWMFNFM